MNTSICPGCRVDLRSVDGPVHRYMESSAACWAKYGELLAREYQNPAYMKAHRLTVDTYAVQHPGRPSPQAIQSVAVHLISLHAILELGFDDTRARALIKSCADNGRHIWLPPPETPTWLTVLHPLRTRSPAEHAKAVHEWATSAWQAWAHHHSQVRAWAAEHVA